MSDVLFSVNDKTFQAVFNKLYPTVWLPFNGSNALGPVWFGVEGEVHLENAGDVTFEDSDTFFVSEQKIGWNKLILRIGFNLPRIKVGKFCVLRLPDDAPIMGGECIVEFPGGELFGGNPDIGPITLNLNAIIPYVVSEISGRYKIGIRKDGDYQKIYADVQAIDVHPISVQDTVGKLPAIVQAAVYTASAQMLALIPYNWLLDAVLGILGFPTVTQYLLNLLDIESDVEEWLMKVLNVSIGIDNLLYEKIFNAVLSKNEVFKIDDPYPFVPEITAKTADYGGFPKPVPTPTFQIPKVAAPVENAAVRFDTHIMYVNFDFGMI